MEINGAFEFLQDRIVIEQLTDTTQDFSELPTSDFQQILVEESINQDTLDNELSMKLPLDGNSLPLEVIPILNEYHLQSPNPSDDVVEIKSKEQEQESEDPVFLITNLLIHVPKQPIEIHPLLTYQKVPLSLAHDDNVQPLITERDETPSLQEIFVKIENGEFKQENYQQNMRPFMQTVEKMKNFQEVEENVATDNQLSLGTMQTTSLLSELTVAHSIENFSTMMQYEKPFEIEQSIAQEHNVIIEAFYTNEETHKSIIQPQLTKSHQEEFVAVFKQKLIDNVSLMINSNENMAKIQVEPPELGKIEITIEQNDDKTDIRFIAQVDQTKQLIENSLDKLKMHFAQSGLGLGQVDVSAGNQEQYRQTTKQTFVDDRSMLHEEEMGLVNKNLDASQSQLLDLYI